MSRLLPALLGLLALAPIAAHGQGSQYALRFYGTGVGPPGQQDRASSHQGHVTTRATPD